MPANVRVSSSWKTVSALYTRVGGSWKNVVEGYTRIGGAWKAFFTSVTPLTVEYLVIAGGGGGGYTGGGGAGGYRTASGLSLAAGTSYTVTVGAGGTNPPIGNYNPASYKGSNSVFATISATGGGGPGDASDTANKVGGAGGSGGGGGYSFGSGGAGNQGGYSPVEGYNGGAGHGYGPVYGGGGGGGAGAVGTDGSPYVAGTGGAGRASSITGTSVYRAGGGGGGVYQSTVGTGGIGGGGTGTAGTVNTGGGGGGVRENTVGTNGGSGVVIIKYPSNYAINPSAGLSHRTVTSAGFNITTFTAGTGTVTFATATTSSYELIQTVYLTSSQASVTLDVSGIASDYQHLQIRATTRTNRTGADSDPIILRFNNDSGSNYARHGLGGYNFGGTSAMYSNAATSQTSLMLAENMPVSSSTANAFGAFVTDILDPFETTKNKTVKTLNGMNAAWSSAELRSGLWMSTAAVTSITILPLVGTQLAANSRFSIYGLKGA